jgi:iron complex transport system permease protein
MLRKRIFALSFLTIAAAAISTGIGATSSGNIFTLLFSNLSPEQGEILTSIRLPRIATALLAGFLIGVAGAILQRAFANPLAEPTLLGTTAAASLGSVVAILFGASSTNLGVTLPSAFVLALVVSLSTIRLAGRINLRSTNLIIVGVALAAFINGVIATIAAISGNKEIRAISFWTSGTLSYSRIDTVVLLGSVTAFIVVSVPYLSKRLDLFVFDDIQLNLLGHSPRKLRYTSLAIASLAVAASVVTIGSVAFIGLAAPFMARALFGESMRVSIWSSGLFGSLLLVISDALARSVAAPSELPITIVTSIIGSPFLIALIVGRKGAHHA